MTEHLRLIARQLAHLKRMREYLAYSTQRVQRIVHGLGLVLLHAPVMLAVYTWFQKTGKGFADAL